MRRLLPLLLLFCAVSASAGSIESGLAKRFAGVPAGESVPVIVRFAGSVAPAAFAHGPASAPAFIGALKSTAARRHAGALALLAARGVTEPLDLWIDNSVAARVSPALAAELAALPDVESVEFDEPVVGAFGAPEAAPLAALSQDPVWSVIKVRAPQVWSMLGLTGSGVVVGSMDTGFDPTHPALAARWRGGSNSWHDFVNNVATPYDDHGHGTHTIGTMVGGDLGGPLSPDVGIAPGAQFISCKVLDYNNAFSNGSIMVAGAQWMMDPDGNPATNDFPKVINNSWSFFSQTYSGYHSTMDAWRAIGIIPVFCIYNNGPGSGTTNPPGNYDNVLGIGSTDSLDVISSFSSRGPSPSGAGFPVDLRKPDLVAPGSAVISSIPGGSYQAWFGTSMATPAVAGTIALMAQGRPGLTYDQARTALISTAIDLGAGGYDYNYGYGRLDALAAVSSATADVPLSGRAAADAVRAWPNPASGAVTFALPGAPGGVGRLEVLDVQGRLAWAAPAAAGATVAWNGRGAAGSELPAGIYLVRYTQGASVRTGRVMRIR